jgi:biopolymer transport protein ExbD
MAEIIESGGGKKHGKKRPKHHSTHVDMTPMVDLACLLLTFFMLTTAFSKPKVMEIVLPEKLTKEEQEKIERPKVDDSKVVNIILEGDKVYWYNGMADPKKELPALEIADYSKDGIRKVLLKRNKDLFLKMDEFTQDVVKGKIKMPKDSIDKKLRQFKKEDKVGPVVLIKAGENVKYGNLVDIIDEMAICNVARYAIIDITPVELQMLANAKANAPVATPEVKNE